MLSFCKNNNETIDFCDHKKYFSLLSYASQLPQPGSIPHPLSLVTSELVSLSPFLWYPFSTLSTEQAIYKHIWIPQPQWTPLKGPPPAAGRSSTLGPVHWALTQEPWPLSPAPFPSTPCILHCSLETLLNQYNFTGTFLCPESSPPSVLYLFPGYFFPNTSPPFGTKHSSVLCFRSPPSAGMRNACTQGLCGWVTFAFPAPAHAWHIVVMQQTTAELKESWAADTELLSHSAAFCTILNICRSLPRFQSSMKLEKVCYNSGISSVPKELAQSHTARKRRI